MKDSQEFAQTRRRKSDKHIPLCTSSFLQDLSIALGRHIKKLRRAKRSFHIEKSTDNSDGAERERLDIESRSLLGILVKATIWEDGIAWIFIRRDSPKHEQEVLFRGHLNIRDLTIAEIGDVLYDIFENHLVPKKLLIEETL